MDKEPRRSFVTVVVNWRREKPAGRTFKVNPPPDPPNAKPAPQTGSTSSVWAVILQAAGAVAGLVAFLYAVGGAILWLEFNAVNLPADLATSLQPRDRLVEVALKQLIGPLLVGLIAALALAYTKSRTQVVSRSWLIGIAAALLVLAIAIASIFPLNDRQRTVIAVTAFVVTVGVLLLPRLGVRWLGWGVFLLTVGGATIVELAFDSSPPVDMQYAAIQFSDGTATSGWYIAATSDTVYIAPSASGKVISQIVSVPRAAIQSIRYTGGSADTLSAAPRSALLFGPQPPAPNPAQQRQLQFEASIAASPAWQYPPTMYANAFGYLFTHNPSFDVRVTHPWTPLPSLKLSQIIGRPAWYSNRIVAVNGKVNAILSPPPDAVSAPHLVLIKQATGSTQAECWLSSEAPAPAVGTNFSLEGLVLAEGNLHTPPGPAEPTLFMACSAGRLTPRTNRASTIRP